MSVRISGGMYRGRQIRSPGGADLRPTTERVRGAVFSIIGAGTLAGARVLDLYAGTGVMAMEAISRGAAWADLVEVDARLVRGIRENLRSLSAAGQARVYRGRTLDVLDRLPGGYDLVFADPPYEMREWDPLMDRLNRPGLINSGGIVVAEHRHDMAMAERYDGFERVTTRKYGDTGISVYVEVASG